MLLHCVKPRLGSLGQEACEHESGNLNIEVHLGHNLEWDLVVRLSLHNSEIVDRLSPHCVLWYVFQILAVRHRSWVPVIFSIVEKIEPFVIEVTGLYRELLLVLCVSVPIGSLVAIDTRDEFTNF